MVNYYNKIQSMNPNFQLNVDCYKINTWLQQRKKMPKDWQICLKACDAKIQTLLQDPALKEYPDANNLIHKYREYFSYSSVLKVCKELEHSKLSSQKNFIGQYTNTVLKGWLSLRAYMKKNIVGLLHTARLINQVLKFDLPGLKRNKESLRNQILMFRRKIDSNNNAIYQNKINFANECKKYSIKGEHIRQQIPKLVEETPSLFSGIQRECDKTIWEMIQLYASFCSVNGSKQPQLPLLQYFCKNGDDIVDVYLGKSIQDLEAKRAKKYEVFKYAPSKQWEIEVGGTESSASQKHQTILTKRSTRLQLINNLNELYFFFQVLQQQLKSGDTHLLSNDYLKIQPSQQLLASYVTKLKAILALLNNSHFNQLIGMYQHPESAQRICHKLELYQITSKRFQEQTERLLQRITQIEGAISQTEDQIQKLKTLVSDSKKIAEEELTALMKKEVRLVGDINKIELEY